MPGEKYNLLDEQWIPVLWADGKFGRVGIKDALEKAGKIRCIAASNPMDRVAILRFLLAVLYWCRGNPPENGGAVTSFPASWFSKLDENKDCFNLLGDGKRFYQDAAARRPRTVTELLQEVPTGNNFWHFRHSTDRQDGLCTPCCAMGLLRLPIFSVSGLPGMKSGVNGVPPIYVIPLGRSLFETLNTNWRQCDNTGIPAWVQSDIRPSGDSSVPLLTGLTALSRRVWLHERSVDGACIQCGARGPLIQTCEFEAAGRLETGLWNDPHVVYLAVEPRRSAKAADLTEAKKFRLDRPWPVLLSRIAATRANTPTSFLVVGFATDNAKNVDVWERNAYLSRMHEQATLYAEQWQNEGRRMEWRIGGERLKELGTTIIGAIRPEVEHCVSARAGELISGTDEVWQNAAKQYSPMMEIVAKSLAPECTTAAVRRRRQIKNVMPDMRMKPEEAKKAKRKKGGEK